MKKITLIFALFASLNTFSQTMKCFREALCDSIRTMALSDMQKNTDIIQYLDKNYEDSLNIVYLRETLAISFNPNEYSEMTIYYSMKEDDLKDNILKMKTLQKLKQIDRAMDIGNERKILYDLFDCFIYKFSIRYEEVPGRDVEYRIKVDNNGMRIIGRKISVILVDDFSK
jgi:hypothetical protein